jgi:hypothetical protein
VTRFKPVLVYVDPEEWPQFQEVCGSQRVSARIRELIAKDLDRFTREEVKAQSLAGLTEG